MIYCQLCANPANISVTKLDSERKPYSILLCDNHAKEYEDAMRVLRETARTAFLSSR